MKKAIVSRIFWYNYFKKRERESFMSARLKRFDAKLDEKELDAMLVTGQNNIYYLTGFGGQQQLSLFPKHVVCS